MLPAEHSAQVLAILPDAREVVLIGTGHRINRPPAADQIAQAVAEFFGGSV